MSAPTKQLGKLSIGENMPATTRSQAHAQREAVPYQTEDSSDSDSEDEEEEGEEQDSPSPSFHVRGRSSISYDLRQLSQALRNRAVAGLKGQFVVNKCRPNYDGFDFQIEDQGRVHLGEGPLTCSCREFESSAEACRHIFWLVDQLHRLTLSRPPSPGVPLSSNGESSRFPPMFELVGDNMEEIAKRVKWPYAGGASSPADSGTETPAAMTRLDKARDLLSCFSETTMPDEFRPDLVQSASHLRTPEECVVQGDFEATMFRLAVHDDNVYTGLRKVMPAGARAAIFFDKIQRRSAALLDAFDVYCETGTRQDDGTALEVPVVVAELRMTLEKVQENIYARAPHGAKDAMDALVALLRDIANRNYDAFENARWGRSRPSGETNRDRNLFAQLIGDADEEPDEFFVLGCLESLPNSILRQWGPQLRALHDSLQTNGAPASYLRKLQALVTEQQGGSSASGQKRPATAGGSASGGRKRTK